MSEELRFEVAGVPSTNHRARSYLEDGRIKHRKAKDFAAWKQRAATAARLARPRGWSLEGLFAVEVVGYMPNARCDADNLRGLLDACEGLIWQNDRQVRPVVYHYVVDKARPRVVVQVVRYDPAVHAAEIHILLRNKSN